MDFRAILLVVTLLGVMMATTLFFGLASHPPGRSEVLDKLDQHAPPTEMTTFVDYAATKHDTWVLRLAGGRVVVNDSPSLALTSQYSLLMWIYLDREADDPRLIDKNQAGTITGYEFDLYQGKLRLCAAAGCQTGNTRIPLNTWVHVAVTFRIAPYGPARFRTATRHGVYLYVNGKSDLSTEHYPIEFTGVTDLPLYIGANMHGGAQFRGLMDEISIWNRTLGPEDIEKVMRESAFSLDNEAMDTLVAYYPVGDVDSVSLHDASPRALNHGTYDGAAKALDLSLQAR